MINSPLLHSEAVRSEKKEKFDLIKAMADLKADVDIRLTDWPQGGKVHHETLLLKLVIKKC